MLSSTQRTFLFAFGLCLVCSMALTLASVGLKDRQDRNVMVDKQKNVLKALGLLEPGKKYKPNEVESLYSAKVKNLYLNPQGQLVETESENPIYVLGDAGNIQRYAVPFKAYGLWSWIYGFIALEGDGETVAGFTVYSHGETPGLGAECEKEWFQKQFIGKKIIDEIGTFISIGVVKGKVSERIVASRQKNYVDGMSGATITSKGIETHLKEELRKYETLSKRLRRKSS